jgi:hypothetical protein
MNTRTPEVERVVRTCERYWKRTGVPRGRIAEMRAELETHLHEAAGEGKSMDSVVGPDVTAFAPGWAREFRPPVGAGGPPGGGGPAMVVAITGLFSLGSILSIPLQNCGGGVVCCPRRVIEETCRPIEGADLMMWVSVFAGVLALVAAVFLARRRLWLGSAVLVPAVPATLLTLLHWLGAAAFLAALIWVQVRLSRAQRAAVLAA